MRKDKLFLRLVTWVPVIVLLPLGLFGPFENELFLGESAGLAAGLLSAGTVSAGILTIGVYAAGLCPIGILASGLFPIGIIAVGVYPIGIWCIGSHPIGFRVLRRTN